jgi:hypothetical protein
MIVAGECSVQDGQKELLLCLEDRRHRECPPPLAGGMPHGCRCGDDCRPSRHPCEVMSCMGVVAFNRRRVRVADEMTVVRQDWRQGCPVIWIPEAVREMCSWVIEPLEGCRLTTTEPPGHGSPRAMIHGVADPERSWFDGRKGPMSSHALARISAGMAGSSMVSAMSRLQASVVVRDTPHTWASKPHDDFPSA